MPTIQHMPDSRQEERHDKRHRFNSLGVGLAIAVRRRVPIREPDAESQMEDRATGSGRRPAYGEQMAKYFRLAHAPSLVIQPRMKPHIAITHLVSEIGLPERTASIPPARAFVVSIHLTTGAERGCDIWVDDRHLRII